MIDIQGKQVEAAVISFLEVIQRRPLPDAIRAALIAAESARHQLEGK